MKMVRREADSKKINLSLSLSFFTSIQRRDGKMSHTDMSGDGKRGE